MHFSLGLALLLDIVVSAVDVTLVAFELLLNIGGLIVMGTVMSP